MWKIQIIYEFNEYEIEIDENEEMEVIQYQLYSLCNIDLISDTILTDYTGLFHYNFNSKNNIKKESIKDLFSSLELRNDSFLRLFLYLNNNINQDNINIENTCTRTIFGDKSITQNMYCSTSYVDPICETCATSCLLPGEVTPMTEIDLYEYSKKNFITDIQIIYNDELPPPNYTKVQFNLNTSASGDFVYCCYKKGGNLEPITSIRVITLMNDKRIDIDKVNCRNDEVIIKRDCNKGTESSKKVFLVIRRIKSRRRSIMAINCCITDINVTYDDKDKISDGYIKIDRNLNDGAPGSSPIVLSYKLSPICGSCCNGNIRKIHGKRQCLFFESFSNEQKLNSDLHLLKETRKKYDKANKLLKEKKYEQHKDIFISRFRSNIQSFKKYNDASLIKKALEVIPVNELTKKANESVKIKYNYNHREDLEILVRDELLLELLSWFKNSFFTWMNNPKCKFCGDPNTRSFGPGHPTQEELRWEGYRVELYSCSSCNSANNVDKLTRFVRYNDCNKLIETRTGRCGEWANCFTLFCRALKFKSRYIYDVTDHVWTEVYSDSKKRWLHCDSCENVCDNPLLYEKGWGKKLSYIFAFSNYQITDVSRRYSSNWDETLLRRDLVDDVWLEDYIASMNGILSSSLSPEKKKILEELNQKEKLDLYNDITPRNGSTIMQGRISGSKEWKESRNEDGNNVPCILDGGIMKKIDNSENNNDRSEDTTATVTTIFKQMTVGCKNSICYNYYCKNYAKEAENKNKDVNTIAAGAILELNRLNANNLLLANKTSLISLLCENNESIVSNIKRNFPTTYLQLCDSAVAITEKILETATLLCDCSGNGNHVKNSSFCPLRRPFTSKIYAMEINSEKSLAIPLFRGIKEESDISIFFLFKLDDYGISVPMVLMSFLTISVIIDQNNRLSLIVNEKNKLSTSHTVLKSEKVYSITLLYEKIRNIVKLYINGKINIVIDDIERNDDKSIDANLVFGQNDGEINENNKENKFFISHVAIFDKILSDQILYKEENSYVLSKIEGGGDKSKTVFDAQNLLRNYNDQSIKEDHDVTEIHVWSGDYIHGIELISHNTKIHDNNDNKSFNEDFRTIGKNITKNRNNELLKIVKLKKNEKITELRGKHGDWIDQITILTNFGRSFHFGGTGGSAIFNIRVPVGYRPITLVGRATDNLYLIGLLLKPLKIDELTGGLFRLLDSYLKEENIDENVDVRDRFMKVSSALERYMSNILQYPENEKYYKIRKNNKYFNENITIPLLGYKIKSTEEEILMKRIGFTLNDDVPNDVWYYFDTKYLLKDKKEEYYQLYYELKVFKSILDETI